MLDYIFSPFSIRPDDGLYGREPLFPPGPQPMLVMDSFQDGFVAAGKQSSPNLGHLILLVFEAVMEVVVIALPGFMLARAGMFPAKTQKDVANITMTVFTPCLIFSKLAAQLDSSKLKDLVIIPVIFAAQTLISWGCAMLAVHVLKLRTKPQKNFVIAMSVFGNSNSLPLSLVVSLSKTISGLHWSKEPNDNDNEVAARGILYLLIFSQLGQALRWSWGASSLLKPISHYTPFERGEVAMTEEERINSLRPYRDHPEEHGGASDSSSTSGSSLLVDSDDTTAVTSPQDVTKTNNDTKQTQLQRAPDGDVVVDPATIGTNQGNEDGNIDPNAIQYKLYTRIVKPIRLGVSKTKAHISRARKRTSRACVRGFHRLNPRVQTVLIRTGKVFKSIYSMLNLPLLAIIISLVVGIVTPLKELFFKRGTFVNNAVTHAVQSMGGVAVPMIITVLGANLAPNTLPNEDKSPEARRIERKMLFASLVCRMVLCTAFMLPLIALLAKFVPISILGDPIFIIVCFLLTGAPSALQLAQICQVNEVFLGAVSKLLFHSYVIWILPSTIFLVVVALEVVNWAGKS